MALLLQNKVLKGNQEGILNNQGLMIIIAWEQNLMERMGKVTATLIPEVNWITFLSCHHLKNKRVEQVNRSISMPLTIMA